MSAEGRQKDIVGTKECGQSGLLLKKTSGRRTIIGTETYLVAVLAGRKFC